MRSLYLPLTGTLYPLLSKISASSPRLDPCVPYIC
jgi:hypothetical protein